MEERQRLAMCISRLNKRAGRVSVVLGWNMLATCMCNGTHFGGECPDEIERGHRLWRLLCNLLDHKPVICLQEVDEANLSILKTIQLQSGREGRPKYHLVHCKGFRFGNAIIAPVKSLGEHGSFRVTDYPIPPGVKTTCPGLREEWAKRESMMVYAEIDGLPIITAHFPVSLADPSLKVLFAKSLQVKIRQLTDKPYLLLVDANTKPEEDTYKYLTEPGFVPEGKYLPWEGFPPAEPLKVLTRPMITNHNLSPRGKVFQAQLDYVFASPELDLPQDDEFHTLLESLNKIALAKPGPSDIWPSDHSIVGATF